MELNVNKIRKRSQIFIFDLILATLILIVSVGIFFSYYGSSSSSNPNLYSLTEQIISSLTSTQINSLNDPGVISMFQNNQIRNIENSVANQISEFHYLNNENLAKNLTNIFVKNYINSQSNINITLFDGTNTISVFSQNPTGISIEDSSSISIRSRTIFGFVNKTSSYGPYTLKVSIWY